MTQIAVPTFRIVYNGTEYGPFPVDVILQPGETLGEIAPNILKARAAEHLGGQIDGPLPDLRATVVTPTKDGGFLLAPQAVWG